MLSPLRFKPIFKEKLWGGEKINSILEKTNPFPTSCGESWEISGVPGDTSVVSEGPHSGQTLSELIKKYQADLVGIKNYEHYGNEFPLLIKFIDAKEDLSIQVHPDDELARKRHHCPGKTEMWYIMETDPGAKLIAGFKEKVSQDIYLDHLNKNSLTDILNEELVSPGDVFFIPAGRVHTIGKGILLAEIQQTSDITYRIYDFDRADKDGNKRELHTENALGAIDFEVYEQYKTFYNSQENKVNSIVKTSLFTTNKVQLNTIKLLDYSERDSFVIYICVQGSLDVITENDSTTLSFGETLLIPACIDQVELKPSPECQVLETYV